MRRLSISIALVLFFLSIASSALADNGPRAFREESIVVHYLQNGIPNSTATALDCPMGLAHVQAFQSASQVPCAYGRVYVTTPNTGDVLQYVRINVSTRAETNIVAGSTPAFFADTLSSWPYSSNSNLALAKKELYVNVTNNETSTYYNYSNNDVAPPIMLNLTVFANPNGGNDTTSTTDLLTPGYSTINVTLSLKNPSTAKALNGIVVRLQLNKDINSGTGDAANISTTPAGCVASDSDGADNQNDLLVCNYNLAASGTNTTSFNMTIHNTNNWNSATSADLDADSKGYKADWGSTTVTYFGNLVIDFNFTRASVREGIDLAPAGGIWRVRGKFTSIANGTPNAGDSNMTYYLEKYSFYEVSSNTLTGPYASTNTGLYISPGQSCPTNVCSWFDTTNSSTTKAAYYAPRFDWYVLWDNLSSTSARNYYAKINTTLNLPIMYFIDIDTAQTSSGALAPDQADQVISINKTSQKVGSTALKTGGVSINAVIPQKTTTGNIRGKSFDIVNSSIMAYWCNSGGTCVRINLSDADVSNSSTEASATEDGKIVVEIKDLSAVQLMNGTNAYNLSNNEYVRLAFSVLSDAAMTTGDSYLFNGTHNQTTMSGTPISENIAATTLSVSSKLLTAYKEVFAENPYNTSIVNVTMLISATTGGAADAIEGIRFMDYVPSGTTFNRSGVDGPTVRFYNGSWNTAWALNDGYNISSIGNVTMPDGVAMSVWEYTNNSVANPTANWSLTNGQQIEVKYRLVILVSGLYRLPVIIAGYDPVTGQSITASNYGVIRVDVPEPMAALTISEDDFALAGAVIVGKPVMWTKKVEAFNPNTRPTTARFKVKVFGDVNGVYASYYNQKGEKMEDAVSVFSDADGRFATWETSIGALESRSYEIRAITPPVLEVDKSVEVLEKLADKKVSLKMDSYLKNFANEPYENVRLNMPIAYDKVTSITDAFGTKLQYTGGAASTTAMISRIEGSEMKTITTNYKESYPIVIITPSRDRYDLNSPVDLSVLIINGGERLDYPYLEIEVYTPEMELVYSAVKNLNKVDALEKTEFTEKFKIPSVAPAGTYIVEARFREDFTVIAQATGNFYVTGASGLDLGIVEVAIVVVLAGVLLYFSTRRLIEVRKGSKTSPAETTASTV